jgi:exopolysaccharide biosynthesis polyprenyl glycosylphosphotransferase
MRQVVLDATVPHRSTDGWRAVVKRGIDIVVAAIALAVLVPFVVLVAIAIKLDSKGPVFFAQTRVGKDRRKFQFYKFRSMCQDAERVRASLVHLNEASGPIFKITRDPRITRVGRFLRRSSLDELPQLINVLKGDMSLVGPRPPLPQEVEHYNDRAMERLSVIPGMTCLWQVNGRSNLSFEQWVDLDLEYIAKRSLWLDFVILLRTVPAVLTARGAR